MFAKPPGFNDILYEFSLRWNYRLTKATIGLVMKAALSEFGAVSIKKKRVTKVLLTQNSRLLDNIF
jgi:hypothetical protein